MQTLEERNTYTPSNTPQVRCNCDPVLNKDARIQETAIGLSILDLKTFSNNSEVDRPAMRKQDLRVPVGDCK